jgi:hypothetical protein
MKWPQLLRKPRREDKPAEAWSRISSLMVDDYLSKVSGAARMQVMVRVRRTDRLERLVGCSIAYATERRLEVSAACLACLAGLAR